MGGPSSSGKKTNSLTGVESKLGFQIKTLGYEGEMTTTKDDKQTKYSFKLNGGNGLELKEKLEPFVNDLRKSIGDNYFVTVGSIGPRVNVTIKKKPSKEEKAQAEKEYDHKLATSAAKYIDKKKKSSLS